MEEKIVKKDEFVRVRNLIILRVLKGTGLRESELVGLNINKLYLDEEIPYIEVLRKGACREIEEKNVCLTGDAVSTIKAWFEYRSGLKNIIDMDAVFVNKNGKKIN